MKFLGVFTVIVGSLLEGLMLMVYCIRKNIKNEEKANKLFECI